MVAAALAGVVLFIAAGLIWTARLAHVGNLDAQALAEKVATPDPVSALDVVGWPAYPRRASTLLLALDSGDDRSVSLLSRWCSTQASVSPTRRGARMELRRRQSLERVHAVLVAEDSAPSAHD
jgi:hypothetical protein